MKRNWLPWVLVAVLAIFIACSCCGISGAWYFIYGPGAKAEAQAFEEQVYPTPIPQEAPQVEVLPEVDMGEVEVPEELTEEEEREFFPMEDGTPGYIGDTACHGKLWTFQPRTDDQGNPIMEMYLIEVQSGSGRGEVNHMDWWQFGHLSISVIERTLEPEESSDYVVGLGSLFVFLPDREGCDWLLEVEDELDGIAREVIDYADSRMDQGHSGLTFDNRNGEMVLIANSGNLPESEVERLRQMYLDAHWSIGQPTDAISVCTGAHPHNLEDDFKGGEEIGPFSSIVVLQPWWGDPNKSPVPETGQVSFILFPGETVTFGGDIKGGPVWRYPGCSFEEVIFDVETWGSIPLWHLDDQGVWVEGPRQPPEETE